MSAFFIKLNGVDFTKAFNRWGVSWTPYKVVGPNQGTSQNGGIIMDLLRTKDVLTLQGNDTPQETFNTLRTICAADVVTAEYLHPASGETVKRAMVPELSSATRKPMHGGRVYLSGWTLTLEER